MRRQMRESDYLWRKEYGMAKNIEVDRKAKEKS